MVLLVPMHTGEAVLQETVGCEHANVNWFSHRVFAVVPL